MVNIHSESNEMLIYRVGIIQGTEQIVTRLN